MKKIYSRFTALLVLFLFLMSSSQVIGQTPLYFKGLGTSVNTIPMNNTGSHCQQLYLPGDFNSVPISGLITKIYFRNSVAATSGTYQNFSVAFIQNALTAFPNTTFLTGFTTALSQASITINGNATAGGWYEIPLTTPFLYDNSQTLIVEIKYTSKTGGMSGFTTTATGNKRLSIVSAPGPLTGNLSTLWGDFGMDVISAGACTSPPTPGTATATPATVCTGAPVQLNLTGHTQGSGQTYVWESATALAGPYTAFSPSSAFSNLTVNPTSTTYYRAAVTCSGNTQFSVPVAVTVNPAFPGGTYTINPALPAGGGNFQTFAAAIAAMNCGISGPVVFNVNAAGGPYNEQLVIPAIAGTSAINTITFNAGGAVVQATPVTADRHLIRLDGADWVRLNNFNLLALPGSTFGWGVHLTNFADNNIINACNINITAVTSTTQSNSAGIVLSGSTTSVTLDGEGSNNTISNCIIEGAYQGIILNGETNTVNCVNNSVINNEVKNWLVTGIEITENAGAIISGNNVHRTNRTDIATTTSQGIELGAENINCLVIGNRIHDSHTAAATQSGTFYGIIANACDAPVGSENRIINNLIYKINSATGTQYGLYNTSSNGFFYYHNTVVLDHAASTAGITRGFFQTTLATGIEFKNNLIYISRGGTGIKYCLFFATTTSTIVSNNNVLYNISTDGTNGIGTFGTTGYTTLLDWQGANGGIYDLQSVSTDPLFMSAGTGDYTPMSLLVNDQGANVGVATDINGNPRTIATPDPGAFEFNVAAGINMGAENLITPVVGTGCFTSAETVTIRIRNSSSATINFATNPVTVTTNVTGAVTQTLSAIVNSGTLASNATLDVPMSAPLNMTPAGSYTFNAFTTVVGDVMPSNDAMPPVIRSKNILGAGTVSVTPNSYCITGGTPTLSAPFANGYGSIQWQQSTTSGSGFTNIVGGTTNPYTLAAPVTQTMYYRAIVTCDVTNVTSNEVVVTYANPSITGVTGATICGTGTASISATGTGNTTFNWYNVSSGGVVLGTGSPFTTPTISSPTTFYVSASTGGLSANLGLPNQLAGINGFGLANFGLVFNVTSAFTLQTVKVYPTAAAPGTNGTVTIDVINGAGTVVHTATVNVVGNPTPVGQVVALNFLIQPGTNYKLRPSARSASITALLFEPSATAPPGGNYGYPFTVPGVVSITHSTLSAAPANTPRLDLYYYFYDWVISNGCESPRSPVVVNVQTPPTATMSYAGSPYCAGSGTANITFSGTAGGTFGAAPGLSINSTTGAVNIAASTPGTYTVTYSIPASGVCPPFDFNTTITLTTPPSATINYPGSPFCSDLGTANVVRTGTAGGTYSSTAGLVINASTGAVSTSLSAPGTYTVTYTVVAGGGCPIYTTTTTVVIALADSWTGAINTDWNNPGNWCGGIPTSIRSVIIPAGVPNMPILAAGTGSARNITIMSGATLRINLGGILNLYGDLYNNGTFNSTSGNISFRGSGLQKMPSFSAINVIVDGGPVLLMGNATVTGDLTLTNGNILLNGNSLSLSRTANGSVQSHIVMDGGVVNVLALGAVASRTVPVGINAGTYNPVIITGNAGNVVDNYTVRVAAGVFVDGIGGATFSEDVVNRTWTITEGVPGGSNIDLTLQWNSFDELIGFDRGRSFVARHNGQSWVGGSPTTASGAGPFTQTIHGVTAFSPFAVMSEDLVWAHSGILYPNPTRGELNVLLNLPTATQVTINIYDAKGSLLMRQTAAVNALLSRTTIDVSRLIPGTYLVRVASNDNEEIFAERFVKLP